VKPTPLSSRVRLGLFSRLFLSVVLGIFGFSETGWTICTGEESRSAAAALRIEQEWPLRPSHDAVTRYLQKLGERLVPPDGSWLKWIAPDDWPVSGWRFFTVRDASVNAFSIGDGRIYITDGSFSFVHNEAELAAILAHEIGHQLAGHFCGRGDQAFNEQRQVGSLLQVIDINKEIEADAIALGLLESAGFPPQVMLEIVSRLPMVGNIRQHRLRLRKLTEKLSPLRASIVFPSSEEFLQIKKSLPY
jgi:predicted Zn-dependent protease